MMTPVTVKREQKGKGTLSGLYNTHKLKNRRADRVSNKE